MEGLLGEGPLPVMQFRLVFLALLLTIAILVAVAVVVVALRRVVTNAVVAAALALE